MKDELDLELEKWHYKRDWADYLFPDGIFHWRASYALTHPWKIFQEIFCRIKWAWQRVFRGWDDRVIWSIDYYLAKNMPLWFAALKNNKTGIPVMMYDEEDWNPDTCRFVDGADEKAEKKYDQILDDICDGFNAYIEIYDKFLWKEDDPEYQSCRMRFEKGMELLTEYYGTFWD